MKTLYFEQKIDDSKTNSLHFVVNQLTQFRQNCVKERMAQLVVHHE